MYQECRGFMVQGIHLDTGYYLGFMSWEDNPTQASHISELWVFDPEGKRKCYFSPVSEVDFFSKYYNFDEVIGAEINEKWLKENLLQINVVAVDGVEYEIIIEMTEWHKWQGITIEGETETGKTYIHEPDKVALCTDVVVKMDGGIIGDKIDTDEVIMVGDASMPNMPVITLCGRKLEK